MKKLILGVAMLGALIFASVALATTITGTGYAGDPWGGNCGFCTVYIQNQQTGAQGSTVTDNGGYYHFTTNVSNTYKTFISTCKVHTRLASGMSVAFSGSQYSEPSLRATVQGSC